MIPSRRRLLGLSGAALLVGLTGGSRYAGGAAGDAVTTDEIGDQVQRLPRQRLPVFAAKPDIDRLYRFAVDRSDVLQYMPCFCGCGRFGHRDNRHCYVKAEHSDGTVTYTSHAAT
jgi:hypothetical protein